MFNKIKEQEFDDISIKYYRSNEKIDYLQLIIYLSKEDDKLIVDENEDVGLKTVDGIYSLEEFVKNYEKIKSSDIKKIRLYTKYYNMPMDVEIYPNSNEIRLVTHEKDLELMDMLKKNNNDITNSPRLGIR